MKGGGEGEKDKIGESKEMTRKEEYKKDWNRKENKVAKIGVTREERRKKEKTYKVKERRPNVDERVKDEKHREKGKVNRGKRSGGEE